jgi:serine/threonine-protein kinase
MIRPQTFGKFRIVRKLPGGAMGMVYQAVDTTSGVMVALKLIDHGTDPDSVEILAAERRGAALHERLSRLDERVARIYEYGDHDGFFFIAMEFIEGHDLAELLAGDGIGALFAARIAADVCQALEQAHNLRYSFAGEEYSGVVHGDIKPRNIRITSGGAVKLLDFGIAKALSETRKQTRNLFGSIQYSSPERLKTGDVDAMSDLWSVAVVLYEAVAHKPYFHEASVSRTEHAIRNYTALRPMPEDAPAALQGILARALAPDPGERYQTASEFRKDLIAFLEDRPVAAIDFTDAEPTRRTKPVLDNAGETRRTTAPAVETADDATRRTREPPCCWCGTKCR